MEWYHYTVDMRDRVGSDIMLLLVQRNTALGMGMSTELELSIQYFLIYSLTSQFPGTFKLVPMVDVLLEILEAGSD